MRRSSTRRGIARFAEPASSSDAQGWVSWPWGAVACEPLECVARGRSSALRSRASVSQPWASNQRPSRSASRPRSCNSSQGDRIAVLDHESAVAFLVTERLLLAAAERRGATGIAGLERQGGQAIERRRVAGLDRDQLFERRSLGRRVAARAANQATERRRSAAGMLLGRDFARTLLRFLGLAGRRAPIASRMRGRIRDRRDAGHRIGPAIDAPRRIGRIAWRGRARQPDPVVVGRGSGGLVEDRLDFLGGDDHRVEPPVLAKCGTIRSPSVLTRPISRSSRRISTESPFPEQQLGERPAGLDGRRTVPRAAARDSRSRRPQPAQGADERAGPRARALERRPAASRRLRPRPQGPRPADRAPPRTLRGDTRPRRRGATRSTAAPAGRAPRRTALASIRRVAQARPSRTCQPPTTCQATQARSHQQADGDAGGKPGSDHRSTVESPRSLARNDSSWPGPGVPPAGPESGWTPRCAAPANLADLRSVRCRPACRSGTDPEVSHFVADFSGGPSPLAPPSNSPISSDLPASPCPRRARVASGPDPPSRVPAVVATAREEDGREEGGDDGTTQCPHDESPFVATLRDSARKPPVRAELDSIRIRTEDLAPVAGAQGPPVEEVDAVLDEMDRAVGEDRC